ncbi:hypothetical protein [Chryseobacterium shigense]|uniref:Uncharacterized protein n=1 Tax=Chryseobacterium shigense TaxID=297244 RepID=A0A841NJT7_9FLAO|nr:hypothetical protein [Chryseobacterium shigense]MBB6372322.1 hypothetical protein [Chryseobacterium shigense]
MNEAYHQCIENNFLVKEDLTHLCICPCCGAPDCGEEYMLITESEAGTEAVLFGGASFRRYLNYWFYEGITPEEYSSLPELVRQNNECTGWQNIEAECTEIDAHDFLRTLEAVKNCNHIEYKDTDFENYYYPVFKSFTEDVINKAQKLYISI